MFDRVRLYEWEVLGQPLNLRVEDPGSFSADVTKAKLYRDDELNVTLEMSGPIVTRPVPELRMGIPGTAVEEPPVVKLASFEHRCTAEWAVPIGRHVSMNHRTGESVIQENVRPRRVNIDFGKNDDPKSLTEWVVNLSTDYMWPHGTDRALSADYECTRGDVRDRLINLGTTTMSSDGCALILTENPGMRVFVGIADPSCTTSAWHPGLIRYVGEGVASLSKDFRYAVRDCLSFALGRPLASLGYSIYAHHGQLLTAYIEHPHLPNGIRSLKESGFPPTILSDDGSNLMSASVLQRIFSACLKNYERFDLQHIFWLYFHAHAQVLDTANSAFGATVEAIRRAYFSATDPERGNILPKSQWREVLPRLQGVLVGLRTEDTFKDHQDALLILERKLGSLNSAPNAIATRAFFSRVGIELTAAEEEALGARNNPAHGMKYDPRQYQTVLHHMRTLHTLCCRMILAITDASDCYIDYSSAGFPVRSIKEGCHGQRIPK